MISYYLFRLFETLFLFIPTSLQKAFVTALAKIASLIDSKHKKVIKANLDLTIKKQISQDQYDTILSHCHKNLALTALQVLRSSKLSVEDLERSVRFENKEIVDEALNNGKNIIFVSAHYGNWELGATSLGALVTPVSAIHKKMNNHYFDEYLMKSRTKFKMNMVEKKGAIKYLIKALRKKEALCMMIDQNINERDGVYVNFLGAKATATAAPAFLARKFDALIIPLLIGHGEGKEDVISFFDPIITPKTDDEENDILIATQAQADWLSKAILDYPKPWFWCHKRWKSAHKDIYQ